MTEDMTAEERARDVRWNMPGKTDSQIVELIMVAIRQAEAAAVVREREIIVGMVKVISAHRLEEGDEERAHEAHCIAAAIEARSEP